MITISLASKYLPLIRLGTKTTTIRRGHRSYNLGPARIFSGRDHVAIDVVQVRHVRLDELTEADAVKDGFADLAELHAALDSFYPRLQHNEPMTVVRFKLQ